MARRQADPFGFMAALNAAGDGPILTVTCYIGDKEINSVTYPDGSWCADAMFDDSVNGAQQLGIENARVTLARGDTIIREYTS